MAAGEVISNLSDFVTALPPEFVDKVGNLVLILEAAGIIFIIYMVYLFLNAVLNWKKYGRMKRIEKKLDSLERKLDKVIKKKKR